MKFAPPTVLKNSAILSAGILLGRISGYLREISIASIHGTGKSADDVVLLLAVPDLMSNLLSSTTIGVIMIPMLSAGVRSKNEILHNFIRRIGILGIYGAIALAIFTMLIFHQDKGLVIPLMIATLAVIPNAVAAVVISYLQFDGRFSLQSLGTLVFNLIFIAFVLSRASTDWLAIGVIICSVARLALLLWDLSHSVSAKELRSVCDSSCANTKSGDFSLHSLFTVVLTSGLLYILPALDKIMASFLSVGSTATLSYAEKLYPLPVSVFLTTQGVAAFPILADLAKESDHSRFRSTIIGAIRTNLAISALVCLGVAIFGRVGVDLLYGKAGLAPAEVTRITVVLFGYLGAIFISGTNLLLVNSLYALQLRSAVFVYGAIFVVAKIAWNLGVIWAEGEVFWIACSTSVLMCLGSVMLATALAFSIRKKMP